ncbi:hypothetical protein [Streptomyces sp. NPDC087294]|uniref:hypothetical protein n=1 Tax=Streptomyces sp. NPDC087294 TaxID=3365777 RepID=UPI00380BED81
MPTKTSRKAKKPKKSRPYLDLNLGRRRITAPKRTVRRDLRALKRKAKEAFLFIAGGVATEIAHLLSRR